MARRVIPRWNTKVGSWIRDYESGVDGLVSDCVASGVPVTAKAVYGWLAGRELPSMMRAYKVVALSGGRITMEDLVRHRIEVSEEETVEA
jgi:hypothetical protein